MTARIFDHDIATARARAARGVMDDAERAFWIGMIYAAGAVVGPDRADQALRDIGVSEAERERYLDVAVLDGDAEDLLDDSSQTGTSSVAGPTLPGQSPPPPPSS